MQALTLMLQSPARAGELSAIENATVVTIPADFHISFLRKLLKAINAACGRKLDYRIRARAAAKIF
jgi:hypothetical protein